MRQCCRRPKPELLALCAERIGDLIAGIALADGTEVNPAARFIHPLVFKVQGTPREIFKRRRDFFGRGWGGAFGIKIPKGCEGKKGNRKETVCLRPDLFAKAKGIDQPCILLPDIGIAERVEAVGE